MFGVLIAVHEFGHFGAAKLFGIRVNEYSIGMGPTLFKKKRGETEYSLRALPIGGFCAIEGEDGESDDPRAFTRKPLWQRFIVLAAGSLMNFFIGFLITLIVYEATALSGSYVLGTNTLSGFMDGFPLEGEDGLMAGDTILSVDGWGVSSTRDLTLFLSLHTGDTVDLTVRRNGQRLKLEDLPLRKQVYVDSQGNEGEYYGLYFAQTALTPLTAIRESWHDCQYYVRMVWVSLRFLLTGRAGVKDLSGPVGMVKAMGDVGSQADTVGEGLSNVFALVAFIAVNLAVMNLLPIPALDGGRIFSMLVFALIGLILRRKPNPKIESYIHAGGLVLLLGLMAFVMLNDIYKLF